MNEVRLTLKSFMSLCKVLIDTNTEKERLRKIVVMQNRVLDSLTSKSSVEKRWIREYGELAKRQIDIAGETRPFYPPKLMIP